jgi:hypothetical protein
MLLDEGFEIAETNGGAGESFENQLVRLSDGSSEVTITRDRGQWMLDLMPKGWSVSKPLDLVLDAIDGSYRNPSSPRELPSQIPEGVRWVDAVPKALAWAAGGPHRAVLVEAAAWYRSDVLFGSVPGRPSLEDFERWLQALAEAIEALASDLPTVGHSEDGGRPHIERSQRGFAYVVVERGAVLAGTETSDGLEILALSFMDTTHLVASRWEMQHRHPTDDFRRRMFAKQLVLLDGLHPAWRRRRVDELGVLLHDAGLDPESAEQVVSEAE